jgi:nucleoid-associated protein YgaU
MFDSTLDSEHAFDRLSSVDRRRTRRRRRLALTLVMASIGAAWAGPAMSALGSTSAPRPVSSSSYVVREGDTLWSIAERVSPGEDPRPLVDAIASTNRVDPGHLIPGQTLLLPAGV